MKKNNPGTSCSAPDDAIMNVSRGCEADSEYLLQNSRKFPPRNG